MKINWKVRLRNREFWLAIVPAICLLMQQILALWGIDWRYDSLSTQLTAIIGTVFAVLALIGVTADPTTPGVSDSARALSYVEPGVVACPPEKDTTQNINAQ